MKKIYLSLGSNQGDRHQMLRGAVEKLTDSVGAHVVLSKIYETESWGFQSDSFLNQVVEMDCHLSADELLARTQDIEAEMGRVRVAKGYFSRPIDIDILFFGEEVIERKGLCIPHRQLHLRKFVLVPLAEIAPDLNHPVLKLTMAELNAQCEDELEIQPWHEL